MLRFLIKRRGLRFICLATFLCFFIGFILIYYIDDKSTTPYFNSKSLNYKKFRKSIDANLKVFHNISWGNFLALEDVSSVKKNASFVVKFKEDKTTSRSEVKVNYNVHIFYYPWYGSPEFDGNYYHWNHPYLPHWNKVENAKWPHGTHVPPHDIGANFYPKLGPYSSKDPDVIDQHMRWIQLSGAGVVSVSWYPPGDADNQGKQPDDLMPAILDSAHKYQLKVNFHIEPFKQRNPSTMRKQVKYIIGKYGNHPAFYKYYSKSKRSYLPLFYIYDSYMTKPSEWATILKEDGENTLRNTNLDGIYIALLVERQHKEDIKKAGFDGFYTYFAADGFTYGSSWKNWREIQKFAYTHNLMFIPSVGPGYIDTRVRAWNGKNIRDRKDGTYYSNQIKSALAVRCSLLSITSFNEWHEGTQIEPAISKRDPTSNFTYIDYGKNGPEFYLNLTRQNVMRVGVEDV